MKIARMILCGFALLICGPVWAQVIQQFTGTISSNGYGGGTGFFGTPVGTQVSGSFSITPSNLGTPFSNSVGNEWSQVPSGSITPNNSDTITVSSSSGSFSAANLQGVVLGETYRAELQYGAYVAGQLGLGPAGALAITCPSSPNLPIDTSAFPLSTPPGCTAAVLLNYNNNQNSIIINLSSLGGQAAPIPQYIDPVASEFVISYSGGGYIDTNPVDIASGGIRVAGAAADGVSQVLIRIPANTVGEKLTLAVLNENGLSDTMAADGGLFTLQGGISTETASPLTVTAQDTPQGPMAFAVYVSPVDFARTSSDYNAILRQLSLQITPPSGTPTTSPLLISRPPVVLVHGLWGKPDAWSQFGALTTDPRFEPVGLSDYSGAAAGVISTNPVYPGSTVPGNALGFTHNAPIVEADIRQLIGQFGSLLGLAVSQADIVAHSMGGDILLQMAQQTEFKSSDNYGNGLVHKLITIDTPFLGSQLAIDLLNTSPCAEQILAGQNSYSYSSITFQSGTESGAVFDLKGAGDGTALSPALKSFKGQPLPFAVSYIAGSADTNSYVALGTGSIKGVIVGDYLVNQCQAYPTDFIESSLTPTKWPEVFGNNASDAVVTVNSQVNGDVSTSNDFTAYGVIHASTLESLGFLGPSVLDAYIPSGAQNSIVVNQVINLLNQKVSSSSFHTKGSIP